MKPRFGAAGNEDAFFAAGFRHTVQAPAYVASMGLDAYEYQCGHGVRVSQSGGKAVGQAAKEAGIALSLHAPYYISMASEDAAIRIRSVAYILQSARAADWMGAERVVVHPGACGKRPRADVLALACETFSRALDALDAAGLGHVHICPETMGKIGQLGTLDEVLTICKLDARLLPCIDFGHLNARTGGGLATRADYAAVLDAIGQALGTGRLRVFHAHFSKIEYTAGGEKRHLTFADTVYGPPFAPLAEELAARGLCPTVICESAGTQAADARCMKDRYLACISP
ncbi:MAG: TIM barrel protein [Ethanoligenens sp.]